MYYKEQFEHVEKAIFKHYCIYFCRGFPPLQDGHGNRAVVQSPDNSNIVAFLKGYS